MADDQRITTLPGKTIGITGKIELYQGKPEIQITSADQIKDLELFRYQGAAKEGGTLEYIFEAGEQNSPDAVTKDKAAEIAADFMTTFTTSRLAP
jgi:hypothetical protein